MKKERQDAILSLIAREEIPTQELLRERVAAMGFEVTQATLSRTFGSCIWSSSGAAESVPAIQHR